MILSNGVKAKDIFQKKYFNNVVNWSGYFIDIRRSQAISFGENSHSLNILVKMEPSETETDPDIVLSFSNSVANSYKELIDSLKTGDEVHFNAKFMALGDELRVNHLHALSLQKTGKNKQLPDIIIDESGLPDTIPEHADTPPKKDS